MDNLIRKYLENKATDQERKVLLDWVRKEGNYEKFRIIKKEWKKELSHKITDYRMEDGIIRYQSFMLNDFRLRNRKIERNQKWYRYAVVGVLLVIVGAGYLSGVFFTENLSTTVFAGKGYVSSVILPDSSKVWINSGSSITYSNDFGENKRELSIKGQAYFEVVKNKKKPFVVNADDVQVKVLGTRFTLEDYENSGFVSVVLEEGAVEMTMERFPNRKILLSPGDKVTYNVENQKIEKRKVKASRYSSWRNGILNFYNSPLKAVVNKLSNRYNYSFNLDKSLEDIKVTFSVNQEDLSSVLELLKVITPIDIKVKEDSVLIMPY